MTKINYSLRHYVDLKTMTRPQQVFQGPASCQNWPRTDLSQLLSDIHVPGLMAVYSEVLNLYLGQRAPFQCTFS
jgi:hypothetical protein